MSESPRTPSSKDEQLGGIFGSPLDAFDLKEMPKESDVIRVWMKRYENLRGKSWALNKKQQNIVKRDVSKCNTMVILVQKLILYMQFEVILKSISHSKRQTLNLT